jgi:hypothetical protein
MKMKEIVSVCLCICLMSGCGKLLNHVRPVDTVVEDKATPSLPPNTSNASVAVPSKTPVPISEPSKSAPPVSDGAVSSSWISCHWGFPTNNINNSIIKYAVNIGLYAVALAVITCAVIYRCVSPEIVEDVYIVHKVYGLPVVDGTGWNLLTGYRNCFYGYIVDSVSYSRRFFIRKVKKTIFHWSYIDYDTKKPMRKAPKFLYKDKKTGRLWYYQSNSNLAGE